MSDRTFSKQMHWVLHVRDIEDRNRTACGIRHPAGGFTDDPGAVTCPGCLRTIGRKESKE